MKKNKNKTFTDLILNHIQIYGNSIDAFFTGTSLLNFPEKEANLPGSSRKSFKWLTLFRLSKRIG